ncbi:hypothetical protein B4113_2670 [Geobacillus sp. B4113_201601]|nr:hypothetical protein B4113_2670 [Geobacillus sp. B4113_201601]
MSSSIGPDIPYRFSYELPETAKSRRYLAVFCKQKVQRIARKNT